MIDYKRASWYGWSYLLHWEGTVMFKVLPLMIIAALLGGWSASPTGIAQLDKMGSARQIFGETYGVQVFGIVFGYLCIARLNICYSRYCACRRAPPTHPPTHPLHARAPHA
jgi:predicted membrane chloride channel (bestrophin family)